MFSFWHWGFVDPLGTDFFVENKSYLQLFIKGFCRRTKVESRTLRNSFVGLREEIPHSCQKLKGEQFHRWPVCLSMLNWTGMKILNLIQNCDEWQVHHCVGVDVWLILWYCLSDWGGGSVKTFTRVKTLNFHGQNFHEDKDQHQNRQLTFYSNSLIPK